MVRARSVIVTLDDSISRRYGREFVNDLLAGLEVDTVAHVGDGPTQEVDLFSRPRATRARAVKRTGRPLLWGGGSHPELLSALSSRLKIKGKSVRFDRSKAELDVELPDNPAGRDIFLVQSKRVSSPEQFHEDMIDMLRTAWGAKKQ